MSGGLRRLLATSALTALSLPLLAQSVPPDNSKVNRTQPPQETADAQKNDATDLDLTKRIRQSLMADKSLSTYAHNIKIVAVNGTVTLNGPVRSQDEKTAVGMKAASVAGQARVVNDLTVAPAQ
jgi:osmotically-inducible protein OsmY